MNILDEIVAYKTIEVAAQKQRVPMAVLEQSEGLLHPCRSLKRFLLDPARTGIIAEFKRRSPSKGIINATADVVDVTTAYAANGASALSVLTDENFFGGSADDLRKARINEIPILRKEFIIDAYQVLESKAMGADVILLIAAILTPQQVEAFTLHAHELGMEVILEVHDESELEHITGGIDVVGVNNRNLKTFTVSLEQSVRLSSRIPAGKLRISESGIHRIEDIQYLKNFGYNGFLIGESFMKEPDPALAFMQFSARLTESLQP